MDYSTISNKTTFTEAEDITNGELSERYYLLKKQFENLSSSYEATKQELHDTRRNYQTALDVQGHLTAELEGLHADDEKRAIEINSRVTTLQDENSALREERTQAAERHASVVTKFEADIRRLKEEQASRVQVTPERDSSELDEARSALAASVADTQAVKLVLEATKAELVQWRLKTEELVSEMGQMRATSELRREELRASEEREALALADLAEARAMLHQCTDSQDLQPHAAKGNSIFAEVEDKRQEMAKNLVQMKQTNSRLKRELAMKQSELEVLLHEKQTIWEQQAGAAAHFDMELIESYEDRITQLEGQCERQRRELARWFGKLGEPTAQGWLPAVLGHWKTECERLRAEALAQGAAQLASAVQLRELRRKLALASAGGAAQRTHSPLDKNPSVDKDEIPVKPVPMPVKRLAPDDVRKKVSFN